MSTRALDELIEAYRKQKERGPLQLDGNLWLAFKALADTAGGMMEAIVILRERGLWKGWPYP